jgi:hypothetical protein
MLITQANSHRTYAILKCGSNTNIKSYTTTSVSNSTLQFSCPPPSSNVVVSRKVRLYLPVRLSFTGVPATGQTLLQVQKDAPRSFPISSSLDTLSVTINNQSVNINLADVIQPLMHYNVCSDLKEREYSLTPTYLDQFQNYQDGVLSTRNPLATYLDGLDGANMQRGGFPFNVVQNLPSPDGVTVMTSIVDVAFDELLYVSPFSWDNNETPGFYNVTTMDFNFTFLGGQQLASRMWSHNDVTANTTPILTASATFGTLPGGPTTLLNNQPSMQFEFITPQETMIIPSQMPITYSYFDVLRFPTDLGIVNAGSGIQTFNSNNLQLNAVPRRMYILIRERNADLFSNPNRTDTYFQINGISMQFLNTSGILASCSQQMLYSISKRNHCQMSWTQWSGGPVSGATFGTNIGTIGSVLCLQFASDIGLPSLLAPGSLSQCQLTIQLNATNISGRNINASMYVIVVNEGTFTINGIGSCSKQIGVISSNDVLDAHQNGHVNYNDVQDVNGGDFFSGLKSFGNALLPYLEKAHNFIRENKIASSLLGEIPHPLAQKAASFARSVGYGDEYGGDGVLVGGRSLHRKDLHKRLARY